MRNRPKVTIKYPTTLHYLVKFSLQRLSDGNIAHGILYAAKLRVG